MSKSFTDCDLWQLIDEPGLIEEIWICGAILQAGIASNVNTYKALVSAGKAVRVVITKPDSAAARYGAERHPFGDNHAFDGMVQQTVKGLHGLSTVSINEALDARFLDFPMDERMHLINPQSSNGTVYVKRYPYKFDQGVDSGGLSRAYTAREDADEYFYCRTKLEKYLDTGDQIDFGQF